MFVYIWYVVYVCTCVIVFVCVCVCSHAFDCCSIMSYFFNAIHVHDTHNTQHTHKHTFLHTGVTGNVMPSDVQLFLESGVDAVCYKPLNTKQFITHIEHTYHNRSYNILTTTTEKEHTHNV